MHLEKDIGRTLLQIGKRGEGKLKMSLFFAFFLAAFSRFSQRF
jgi:hypothetical protein